MDPLAPLEQLVEAGRFKEALALAQHLPSDIRRSPIVWAVEAELLVETGDLVGGIALAQRAAHANQASAKTRGSALRVLGQATFHLGEPDKTRTHLRHALDLANSMRPRDRQLEAAILLVRWRLLSRINGDIAAADFEEVRKAFSLRFGTPPRGTANCRGRNRGA